MFISLDWFLVTPVAKTSISSWNSGSSSHFRKMNMNVLLLLVVLFGCSGAIEGPKELTLEQLPNRVEIEREVMETADPEPSTPLFFCPREPSQVDMFVDRIRKCRPEKTGLVLTISVSQPCLFLTIKVAFCKKRQSTARKALKKTQKCVIAEVKSCDDNDNDSGFEKCVRRIIRRCARGIIVEDSLAVA